METVPGTAGVLVPPPGYLEGIRTLCDKYGIVLIFDEVMCGFGRTGDWFAWQNPVFGGVQPDLITFAKGVNSGYVPAGGVVISDSIANEFTTEVFPGGLTYSGHPLAMASIVATLDAMSDEKIVENAASIGADVLGPGLLELAARHPMIGEVRGVGVFWALDLVDDPSTRTPVSGAVIAELKSGLMAAGLLPFSADNRIHVVPPCIVTADEVTTALSIYDEVFTAVEA
jgi:taurine--2-oxoglutarate transaminase